MTSFFLHKLSLVLRVKYSCSPEEWQTKRKRETIHLDTFLRKDLDINLKNKSMMVLGKGEIDIQFRWWTSYV